MNLSSIAQVSDTERLVSMASGQQIIAGLNRVKLAVRDEFRKRFGLEERVLQLALNEAEALAWQSSFPVLVFPTLAQEKAEAAAAWNRRQAALRRARPALLEAA